MVHVRACVFGCCANNLWLLVGKTRAVTKECRLTKLCVLVAGGAFIDQSQSFNVFMVEPNYAKLSSMHFYAWKKGLKTGMYYLRSRPAANAIQFTVDQSTLAAKAKAGSGKEAAAAYDVEARSLHGDQAATNFKLSKAAAARKSK